MDNIASSRRQRDYRPLRTSTTSEKIIMSNGQANAAHDDLERLALQSLTDHTIALERVYTIMLRQMDELSTQVRIEEADLKAIQGEVDSAIAPLK